MSNMDEVPMLKTKMTCNVSCGFSLFHLLIYDFFIRGVSLGLPYIQNFPDMSRISVLKFVFGNNFDKCFNVWNFDSFRGSSH